MFIPGEIEDNAYAQFRGGGKEGGGGVTRSLMGDVHKHIFPSTLFTDEGSEGLSSFEPQIYLFWHQWVLLTKRPASKSEKV